MSKNKKCSNWRNSVSPEWSGGRFPEQNPTFLSQPREQTEANWRPRLGQRASRWVPSAFRYIHGVSRVFTAERRVDFIFQYFFSHTLASFMIKCGLLILSCWIKARQYIQRNASPLLVRSWIPWCHQCFTQWYLHLFTDVTSWYST